MFLNMQLLIFVTSIIHVSWVPCHYGMACSQVSEGGDALQSCEYIE
jgi:hypothetical protein